MERPVPQGPIRIQRLISMAGIASRRIAEDMITDSRVHLNGKLAELGDRATVGVDVVTIDGIPVMADTAMAYWLVNKPVGVVSTTVDTHERPKVIDLVPAEPRVYPVGRLDADSEGLIILTNDGEFTNRMTHPRFKVEKEYLVKLDRPVSREVLSRLRSGVELSDGPTAPSKVTDLGPGIVRMVISEGRNRQIRRMFELFSYRVERLVRTRIGPVSDNQLKAGHYRPLSPVELGTLWAASSEEG